LHPIGKVLQMLNSLGNRQGWPHPATPIVGSHSGV
jgi:hypothetical protein